jgi:hypothetical protein
MTLAAQLDAALHLLAVLQLPELGKGPLVEAVVDLHEANDTEESE